MLLTDAVTVINFRTAIGLLNTGAGVNLVRPSPIPTGRKYHNKRLDLPGLCTATRRTLQLDALIILHLRLGDQCACVWFGVALHLAVDILLQTTFKDQFIHGISPTESKVEPWSSSPVATVARKLWNTEVKVAESSSTRTWEAEQVTDGAEENYVVRVACQVMLKPSTPQHVLFTTTSSVLLPSNPGYWDQVVNVNLLPPGWWM